MIHAVLMHNMEILRGSSAPFKKFQGNVPDIRLKKLRVTLRIADFRNKGTLASFSDNFSCYKKSNRSRIIIRKVCWRAHGELMERSAKWKKGSKAAGGGWGGRGGKCK